MMGLKKAIRNKITTYPVIKNLAILTSGTIIAQIIPILIMPVLTRLYSPELFGFYSIILAVVGTLIPFSTARYEHAIMLPKAENEASALVVLIAIIATTSSLFLFLVGLFIGEEISHLLFGTDKYRYQVLLIPLIVFFTGCSIGLNYYSNRLEKYKTMSVSRVVRALFSSSGQITLFLAGAKQMGLGLGYLVGEVSLFLFLLVSVSKNWVFKFNKNTIYSAATRYQRFPRIDILSTVISQISQRGLLLIFWIIFGPAVAGFYGLTRHVLAAPLAFVGTSVADIFKQNASKSYRKKGDCRKVYWQFFTGLLITGFIGFLVLRIYGAEIFSFVFGEQWREAGNYAEILSVVLLFRFVSSPLSYILYIAEKQEKLLIMQILFLIVMLISAYFGFLYQSVEISLYIFSYLSSCIYTYILYISYKYSIK